MAFYQTKPEIVDAWRPEEVEQEEAPIWFKQAAQRGEIESVGEGYVRFYKNGTGYLRKPGDWFVKAPNGEIYIWSDEDFKEIFQRVYR